MSTDFPAEGSNVVLVVEDEPVLRASMVRGLSKLPGVDVVDAGSVRDAKELIRALDAKLLISDLDLPDGSGVELAAEMELCGKRVPIVFVSAYAGKYQGQLTGRPGVVVQEKPVSVMRLRAIVESYLGGSAPTSGDSPFSISDYVQFAVMGRRSVQLQVHEGAILRGTITIKTGEVWGASDDHGIGLEAFRRLALAEGVTVACHALSGDAGERTIHGSAESVLFELARVMGEERPSSDADFEVDFEDGWSDSEDTVRRGRLPMLDAHTASTMPPAPAIPTARPALTASTRPTPPAPTRFTPTASSRPTPVAIPRPMPAAMLPTPAASMRPISIPPARPSEAPRHSARPPIDPSEHPTSEFPSEFRRHGSVRPSTTPAARPKSEPVRRVSERRSEPPSEPFSEPPPTPAEELSFDDHFERGVDALLVKNHRAAYLAFVEASRIRPNDSRVIANLHRLREMGFANDEKDEK